MAKYYASFARGGFGFIITEGTYTDELYSQCYLNQSGLANEKQANAWKQVVDAIREAVGPDFIVGMRISQGKANDYIHKWSGSEEDAKVIFSELGKEGLLHYIHIAEYQAWMPAFSQGESLVQLAKKYAKTLIMANGQLEDPKVATTMIGPKQADFITLGKGTLAKSDWVNKVRQGKPLLELDQEKLYDPMQQLKILS